MAEICGGNNRMSVYSIGPAPTPTASLAPTSIPDYYEYMGCYVDDKDNRIMTLEDDGMDNGAEVSKDVFCTATSERLCELHFSSQYDDADFLFREYS